MVGGRPCPFALVNMIESQVQECLNLFSSSVNIVPQGKDSHNSIHLNTSFAGIAALQSPWLAMNLIHHGSRTWIIAITGKGNAWTNIFHPFIFMTLCHLEANIR